MSEPRGDAPAAPARGTGTVPVDDPVKWRILALLFVAEVMAMALWLSASAVVPQLAAEWGIGGSRQAWLTMSVQLGFVAGALASALLNLSDRVEIRWLISTSALLGAAGNAAIPWLDAGFGLTLVLRFLTGAALAGVYPPAMQLVASWCREDRGLGIGLLIGALTIGTALPHLLDAAPLVDLDGVPPWRALLWTASGLAAGGALIIALFVRPGPYLGRAAPFNWRYALRALADRPTRLANFGYFGHMWELYAMWVWAPALLLESYVEAGWSPVAARLAGFAIIAAGAGGCVLAGFVADRWGRTRTTIASLAVSGGCALAAGLLFSAPGALTLLCLVWGFAVVADSAQFSAAVTELADPRYVGTALAVQTGVGFLLTLVTIQMIPPLVAAVGWTPAFGALAIGPAFGIWSMARLRRLPEAVRMAGGNR